jgi:hypothetical protein
MILRDIDRERKEGMRRFRGTMAAGLGDAKEANEELTSAAQLSAPWTERTPIDNNDALIDMYCQATGKTREEALNG